MNTHIPAICENEDCGHYFPSGLILGPNASGTLNVGANLKITSRCPLCGSRAPVPDGIYTNIEPLLISLLRSFDSSELLSLAKKLKRELEKDKSPKNIKKSLSKQFPEKSGLWSLIPKPSKEALIALNIIFIVINAVASMITILSAVDELTDDEIKENIINPSFEYHFHLEKKQPSPPNKNQEKKHLLPPKQKSI